MKIFNKYFSILIVILSVIFYSCQPNTCGNNVLDGDETGIDCGGTVCPACPCTGGGTFIVPYNSIESRNVTILNNQSEIDSFGAYNYEIIEGDLYVNGANDLTPLCGLNRVEGRFWLGNSDFLINLDGLENLSYVEYLSIVFSKNLLNINGLSSLEEIESGHLSFYLVNSLDDINILDNIVSPITNFVLIASEVNNLNLFANLNTNNMDLINIESNPNLTDFCGLQTTVNNNNPNYIVLGNLYNPTLQDLQNGDCTP